MKRFKLKVLGSFISLMTLNVSAVLAYGPELGSPGLARDKGYEYCQKNAKDEAARTACLSMVYGYDQDFIALEAGKPADLLNHEENGFQYCVAAARNDEKAKNSCLLMVHAFAQTFNALESKKLSNPFKTAEIAYEVCRTSIIKDESSRLLCQEMVHAYHQAFNRLEDQRSK